MFISIRLHMMGNMRNEGLFITSDMRFNMLQIMMLGVTVFMDNVKASADTKQTHSEHINVYGASSSFKAWRHEKREC